MIVEFQAVGYRVLGAQWLAEWAFVLNFVDIGHFAPITSHSLLINYVLVVVIRKSKKNFNHIFCHRVRTALGLSLDVEKNHQHEGKKLTRSFKASFSFFKFRDSSNTWCGQGCFDDRGKSASKIKKFESVRRDHFFLPEDLFWFERLSAFLLFNPEFDRSRFVSFSLSEYVPSKFKIIHLE